MGVEACAHQFVVYVVLVRQERVTSVPYAARHHPYHVKTWDDDGADSYDAHVVEIRIPYWCELPIVQYKERQGETQCQTASVAHESLVLMCIYVVVEKRYQYSHVCQ